MNARLMCGFATVTVAASAFWAAAVAQKIQLEQPPSTADESIVGLARMSWGEADASGLQMGAWRSELNDATVHCAIRNQGPAIISYNLCFLGQAEGVSVLARAEGEVGWKAIPKKVVGPLEGVGPAAYKVVSLPPGGYIPNYAGKWRYKTGRPSSAIPFSRMAPRESRVSKFIGSSRFASPLPTPTFTVNLSDYDWPKSWTGNVEFQVQQLLMSDQARPSWQGTLKSGVLTIPAAILRGEPIVKTPKTSN